jgi:hypothetical protein
LVPNILFSTPISSTQTLCSSLNVSDQVSHPRLLPLPTQIPFFEHSLHTLLCSFLAHASFLKKESYLQISPCCVCVCLFLINWSITGAHFCVVITTWLTRILVSDR